MPRKKRSTFEAVNPHLDVGINPYFRAIEETMERLDILIALRKASEAVPPGKCASHLILPYAY